MNTFDEDYKYPENNKIGFEVFPLMKGKVVDKVLENEDYILILFTDGSTVEIYHKCDGDSSCNISFYK